MGPMSTHLLVASDSMMRQSSFRGVAAMNSVWSCWTARHLMVVRDWRLNCYNGTPSIASGRMGGTWSFDSSEDALEVHVARSSERLMSTLERARAGRECV